METKPKWLLKIEKEKQEKSGSLDLSLCELEKIPAELLDMPWLANLDLADNRIEKIEHLENLINLEVLYFENNRIRKIENVQNLIKLQTLFFSQNAIRKIENIEKLTNLISFSLLANEIEKIENLDESKKIKLLSLNGNKISKMENLHHLKNLDTLYLDKNLIKKLENINENINLSKLDLNENYIESIEELKDNNNLIFLGLSNNKIQDISVLHKHSKIQQLYLSQNPLNSIDVIENLPDLKRVVLSNTGITSLKPLMTIIKKGIPVKLIYGFEDTGDGIFIKDNNELDISKEIIEQGNDAIIQFYELQQNKSHALDEIYLNEAKLILVGEGKVGKTSLRVKLINPEAELPKDDERTRGIDIDQYSFQLKNQETYKAHIWDFGGQNIQYALHRFFMTENSLYILMTESRNERDKNFMYWFQNIDLFGGKNSPILIVMNLMHGDRGANIDIASYVSEFKKIINNEILEVNLLNPEQDNCLQKLRTIVEQQLENLPHIRKPVFRCWLDVREALLSEAKDNKNFIDMKRYEEICDNNGVNGEEHRKLVGRYLHNLGIVLWYHDKDYLRNIMILKPMWAITAIYKIIDDKKIQDNKGKFDNTDLDSLWNEVSYKFSKDELTSMLKVFKICFQRRYKNEYIVPALMEANPPAIAKGWDNSGCTTVTFEYVFMPKGIANQLTADLHQHIQDELNHVWAYGLVLHYAEDLGTMAMIVENTYNRKITIDVKGNYANRFLGTIIQELKNINNSYFGLKSEMKIPCTCSKCKTLDTPQLYTEQDLLEKLKDNKTTVFCNKLDDRVSIQPVLESIGITHPIFDKLKREERGDLMDEVMSKKAVLKKKVFVSYAHALTNYFDVFITDLKSYLKITNVDFEIFEDFQIPVGSRWDDFLQDKVAGCDIMILLVSQQFITSDFIQEKEFGAAVSRLKNEKEILIVPVYFGPCNFNDEKDLSQLQFFKPDGTNYDQAQKGKRFSYIDLVTFTRDNLPVSNPNRSHYMNDFVNKLRPLIK